MEITNWSVVDGSNNPYLAPEQRRTALHGEVWGHPKHDNGVIVNTSPIKDVKGRKVFTSSGSTYNLGKIDPGYRKYLRNIRPEWDWRNPIIIKG